MAAGGAFSYLPMVQAVAGFLAFFIALWLATTWMIGGLSGWRRLARAFPDRPESAIDRKTWASARMARFVSFNNCLTFEICPGGLRVTCPRILRPFDPPFLVPWSQIAAIPHGGTVQLDFGRPIVGRVTIGRQLYDHIAKVAPADLSVTRS